MVDGFRNFLKVTEVTAKLAGRPSQPLFFDVCARFFVAPQKRKECSLPSCYDRVASIWHTRCTVSRWLSLKVRNSNP
jgi:hypothetical protein